MIDYSTAGAKRQSRSPAGEVAVCGEKRSGEHGIQVCDSRALSGASHEAGADPGQRYGKKYSCEVTILAEGRQINGKSILSVLSACIRQGSRVEIRCSGEDEQAALEEAAALIQSQETGA